MLKQEIIKLCGEITVLSILVSNVTKHHVFINYSGHVNSFDIRICENGWKKDGENEYTDIRISFKEKKVVERLQDSKDRLNKLLIPEIDIDLVAN